MTTSSYTVDFDRRDEAEGFLNHEKPLLEKEGYEYLDHNIWYSEDLDRWLIRIDYTDLPPTPDQVDLVGALKDSLSAAREARLQARHGDAA